MPLPETVVCTTPLATVTTRSPLGTAALEPTLAIAIAMPAHVTAASAIGAAARAEIRRSRNRRSASGIGCHLRRSAVRRGAAARTVSDLHAALLQRRPHLRELFRIPPGAPRRPGVGPARRTRIGTRRRHRVRTSPPTTPIRTSAAARGPAPATLRQRDTLLLQARADRRVLRETATKRRPSLRSGRPAAIGVTTAGSKRQRKRAHYESQQERRAPPQQSTGDQQRPLLTRICLAHRPLDPSKAPRRNPEETRKRPRDAKPETAAPSRRGSDRRERSVISASRRAAQTRCSGRVYRPAASAARKVAHARVSRRFCAPEAAGRGGADRRARSSRSNPP